MTYTRMVRRLAKTTGYPENVVRHILDAQREIIRTCMVNQEEVHFPGCFKLRSERQKFNWKGIGSGEGERIVLRVRPMLTLRKELNQWTSLT